MKPSKEFNVPTWVYVSIFTVAALMWAAQLMAQNCNSYCVQKDRYGNCVQWQSSCTAPPQRQIECRQECTWLDPQTGCKEYRTVCR